MRGDLEPFGLLVRAPTVRRNLKVRTAFALDESPTKEEMET